MTFEGLFQQLTRLGPSDGVWYSLLSFSSRCTRVSQIQTTIHNLTVVLATRTEDTVHARQLSRCIAKQQSTVVEHSRSC
jgi:hypothetical protein